LAVALIGIVSAPIYLWLLGAEGYGLFGFYVVLQSWMILFDLGLTPTVARQLSRYRAGVLDAGAATGLWKAAEILFWIGGVAVAVIFFLASGWVARHWLGPSRLTPGQINLALQVAGCMMAGRWMAALYQNALVGLERQSSANLILLVGALLRPAVTVAALLFIAKSPVTFFAAQSAVTVAEAAAYRLLLFRTMPRAPPGQAPRWRLLSNQLGFAAGIAVSAAITTMINQSDKLALSHVLPLAEFGIFSLVVSICSGIALVVPPFAQAFQPRLTTLLAQRRREEFVHVYRLALALIIALAAGTAGTIAAEPQLVLYAWTGSRQIAHHLGLVLSLYALGAGINAVLFAPFVLQYACGRIRLHVIGNVLFGAVWIPLAVWAAYAFGPIGTAVVWLAGNLLFLIIWAPLVHRRLLSSEERRGIGRRSWLSVAVLGAVLAATRLIDANDIGRLGALGLLASIGAVVTAVGLVSSRDLRDYARLWLSRAALPLPSRPR
jgi:O-antigen/teichoic acid export membrane protein